MEINPLVVASRWVHVISACVLIGSLFFHAVILPGGGLESAEWETALRRWRRGLKMTVHVTLLLFLVTGVYNTLANWPIYTRYPGFMHGLFGLHLLLGLIALTLLMVMLAGREAKATRAGWARGALILLMLGVAAASTLKSARMGRPSPPDIGQS